MYLMINKKKMPIICYNRFLEKFKGLKFVLKPIDSAYRFCSKYANTYLLCQRVDIIMTDIDNKVLYKYTNIKSEKIILPKRKVFYTYFLPVGTCDFFKVGDILKIKKNKSEQKKEDR